MTQQCKLRSSRTRWEIVVSICHVPTGLKTLLINLLGQPELMRQIDLFLADHPNFSSAMKDDLVKQVLEMLSYVSSSTPYDKEKRQQTDR